MRLNQFDLNLLVAFDALMAERSVTRAAGRLNLTQSATSAALKRLREAFQDDLLVLHGKTMVPTPHALALAPEIADAIVHLRNLVSTASGFNPATSERRFRIVASDYITTVLIVPLLRVLQAEAPSIRLDIALPREDTADRLAKGEYDFAITPIEFSDQRHPTELLWEERHVVVGWEGNPLLSRPLTMEDFARSGHVTVQIGGRNTFVENILAQLGFTPRIEVHAPSFIQIPWLLTGTMRLALMHERLATLMAPGLGLRLAAPPFEIPLMREILQYHSTRSGDQGLLWLRGKFRQVAQSQPLAPLDHSVIW